MATLKNQLAKAQGISQSKLIEAIFKFIRGIESEIVALNKEQLFQNSEDIFGEALGFYSKATEFITLNNALLGKGNKIKRAGDPFDLEDTGDFLEGLFAKVSNGVVTFGSTDPKTDLILNNESLLTKDLFGLSEKNLTLVIREKILPFYLNSIRNTLDL